MKYPNLLWDAAESGRVGNIRWLSYHEGTLPGYDGTTGKGLRIEVLGPVADRSNGSPRLKTFGDVGKTKNGHSVVLRLVYKDVSILLGGDLNIPAENHLLRAHTGFAVPAEG